MSGKSCNDANKLHKYNIWWFWWNKMMQVQNEWIPKEYMLLLKNNWCKCRRNKIETRASTRVSAYKILVVVGRLLPRSYAISHACRCRSFRLFNADDWLLNERSSWTWLINPQLNKIEIDSNNAAFGTVNPIICNSWHRLFCNGTRSLWYTSDTPWERVLWTCSKILGKNPSNCWWNAGWIWIYFSHWH